MQIFRTRHHHYHYPHHHRRWTEEHLTVSHLQWAWSWAVRKMLFLLFGVDPFLDLTGKGLMQSLWGLLPWEVSNNA